MQRPSVYLYTITEPPGVNVNRLRNALGWPMRELAARCHPVVDHTTIRRLEHNDGFTQDTVERVAKALAVTKWQDLFLPPELAMAGWSFLTKRDQSRLAKFVQDTNLARHHRMQKPKR